MGSAVEAPEQLVLLPPQPWCRGPVPLSPPPGEDTSSAGVLLPLPHTHRSILSAGTRGTEHSPSTPAQGGDTPGWRGPGPAPGAGRLRPGALPAARGCRAPSPGAACQQLPDFFITFFFLIIFFLPASWGGSSRPVPSLPGAARRGMPRPAPRG